MDDAFEPRWDDGNELSDDTPTSSARAKNARRNLQAPVYKVKHGMGFFGVVGGTGCYSSVVGGQAQGNFQAESGTLNIFVPYLRGFASTVISDGLQDSAFAPASSSAATITKPNPSVGGGGVLYTPPDFPTLDKEEYDTLDKEEFDTLDKEEFEYNKGALQTQSITLIDWDTSNQAGVKNTNTHGWSVFENGLGLKFKVEDSYICPGGENSAEQKGTAKATIVLSQPVELTYSITGQGEQLDTGFEMMTFKVDGTVLATATSTAMGKECASGPLTVDYKIKPPYKLPTGTHELVVTFTTADGFDHTGSYYQINLDTV